MYWRQRLKSLNMFKAEEWMLWVSRYSAVNYTHHGGLQQGIIVWDAIRCNALISLIVIFELQIANRYINDNLAAFGLSLHLWQPGFIPEHNYARPHKTHVAVKHMLPGSLLRNFSFSKVVWSLSHRTDLECCKNQNANKHLKITTTKLIETHLKLLISD